MTFEELLEKSDMDLATGLALAPRSDGVVFAVGDEGYFEAWSVGDTVRMWADVDPEEFDPETPPTLEASSLEEAWDNLARFEQE